MIFEKYVYICFVILHVFMQLILMSLNTRGLMSSTICLTNLLQNSTCDLVVLSEHKLPRKYSKYFDSLDNNYMYYAFSKCEPQAGNELHGKAGVAILILKSAIK